jgi:hypothetical protein
MLGSSSVGLSGVRTHTYTIPTSCVFWNVPHQDPEINSFITAECFGGQCISGSSAESMGIVVPNRTCKQFHLFRRAVVTDGRGCIAGLFFQMAQTFFAFLPVIMVRFNVAATIVSIEQIAPQPVQTYSSIVEDQTTGVRKR